MLKLLLNLIFLVLPYLLLAETTALEQKTDSLLAIIQASECDTLNAALYNDLAVLHFYSNPDKAIGFSRKEIDLRKKNDDFLNISDAYVKMINAHFYKGSSSDLLLTNIKELENHVLKNIGEKDMMRVHWLYAMYYDNILQPDKEIEAYLLALDLAKKHLNDPETEAGLTGNIGAIFLEEGKYEEALPYFEEGINFMKDDIGRADLLYKIGIVYEAQGKFEEALLKFKEAYKHNEIGSDFLGMANSSIKEAQFYDRNKNYTQAHQIYYSTIELAENNNVGSVLPFLFVSVAEHYHKRADYSSSINFAHKAILEIEKQKKFEKMSAAYEVLHASYAANGNYEKAYEYRGKQLLYLDSIQNSQMLFKVEALKTEFEVEQKEIENKLLKIESAANQKTIQSTGATALALLLGLLLIASWAFTQLKTNQRKQKLNEKLEATVKERTFKLEKANQNLAQANYELSTFNYIASHDIKEPIRNIGSYISLVYQKLPVDLQIANSQYFDRIKKSTSQLYCVVEDFSKYSQLSKEENIEIASVNLNDMLSNLKMSFGNFEEGSKTKISHSNLPIIQTNSTFLYTILKNLIENGLKFNHSAIPTVNISYEIQKDCFEIRVTDNGIGIETQYHDKIFGIFKRLNHRKEFEGSGIGLAIVKLLVTKLGAKIHIESLLEKGSTFVIQLPKNDS